MGRGRKKVKTTRPVEEEDVEDRITRPEEEAEDRISMLSDDLIYHILSFVSVNDSIKTSQLSSRWRHVWKSVHHLQFDGLHFKRMTEYCKFVAKYLSHRNPNSDISVLNLRCSSGSIQQPLIKKVAVYAASHKVQSLDISTYISWNRSYKCGGYSPILLSDFSCPSLKHLCLVTREVRVSNLPKSTWSLPALTTLVLGHVSFMFCCDRHSSKSADPFSNLFSLKSLTLHDCRTDGLKVFNLVSPQLETLVVKCVDYRYLCEFVVSAPKLVSFEYFGSNGLIMSANDLHCLDQIDINIGGLGEHDPLIVDYEKRQKHSREVINMFRQLRGARSVSLTLYTIEVISWLLDSLENESSPFSNMESLKIEGQRFYQYDSTKLPTGVITYLCNSSPNSIVSIESNECFGDS